MTDAEWLLAPVRRLYPVHGIKALSTRFLQKEIPGHYNRLRLAGYKQSVLLSRLGLEEEFEKWRDSARTYRGVVRPKWSWEVAINEAKQLREREGDLPTVQWCRLNGHSHMTNVVHKTGHTWEDLRIAIGSPASTNFYESRSGIRWRSRPEASLSNFLFARGIEHKRGEAYGKGYAEETGQHFGYMDMHFKSSAGAWIDVEVWGDLPDNMTDNRYAKTRVLKEKWQSSNPNFLGIQHQDCLSDARLTKILKPYIGTMEPFQFEQPQDKLIETSHWTDADELLVSCQEFAKQFPDGIFPSQDWLRKRGKYADRDGPTYNTLAHRVNEWLGGTRNVRKLLGQNDASTIEWTAERAIAAWQDFYKKYGLTPSQCQGRIRRTLPPDVAAQSSKIYQATRLHGVLKQARAGHDVKRIWTRDYTLAAWREFYKKHGRLPTECRSAFRRRIMPREVTAEAARIYSAARHHKLLETLKSEIREDNSTNGEK